MMENKTSPYKEFKYGWPVVGSSAVGIGLGMSPLPFYTIGVFVGPFMKEFGWTVDQVLFAISLFSITALFTSPLIGLVTDKFGARKTVLVSIVTFGLAFMAFALNNGSLYIYWLLWVMLAFFGSGTLPITFTKAINNWFIKKRGLALGLSLLGTGLFGAFAKYYASYFIEESGWRMAYVALAALPLLLSFPLAYFFFRNTDDPKVVDKVKAMRKDVGITQEQATNGNNIGKTLKEAFKDYRLWLLVLSFIPISVAVGGPIPNLEKIMDSNGFSVADGVFIASLIGYSVIIGRLAGGYLIDKFWAPGVAFIIFIIPVISCYIFMQPELSYTNACIAVCLIGLAAGVEYDLMAFLVSKYFGMKNYSSIYGFIYGFFAIGAGFGPWIYGKSFTMTGSYATIFHYSIYAFVLGAIPLLFLGKYKYD